MADRSAATADARSLARVDAGFADARTAARGQARPEVLEEEASG
jgi:hypothetical protein